MVKPQIAAVLVIVAALSLVGGYYLGYQNGDADSKLYYRPVIEGLEERIANVTAENEAFRKVPPSLAGKTIKLGYIAPDIETYTVTQPYIEKVIKLDLDAYASSLGLDVHFEFVMLNANGQADTHLELVQGLHNDGVDIFIGAGWSSMCCASLSYQNVNHMLAISPSSTSPTCAIANDSMFRMCPADSALAPALANIIWSYGVKEVVLIQRGDSYADGIVNMFVPEFVALGGVVSQPIRYNVTDDVVSGNADFCAYLQTGRDWAQAAIARMGGDNSRVCVLLIAYDEAARIIKQASQCDVLYNLVWFGADSTAKNGAVIRDSPLEANHLKLFSPMAQKPTSTKYTALEARYVEATGGSFNMNQAYLYDAAYVLARTIIEASSYNATKVAAALPGVCEKTYGVTGWCKLNQYGDRTPPPFDIWYYAPGVIVPSEGHIAGDYDPDTGITTWNARTPDFTVQGP